MFYKRKILLIIAIVFLSFSCLMGCVNESSNTDLIPPTLPPDKPPFTPCFSVNFIDVGEGDCIFIQFNDGKTMLIDSGDKNENLSNKIVDFIKKKSVDKIDYFLLTHPDSDHIGNALDIIENFDIGVMFLPDITLGNLSLFPLYQEILDKINQKEIAVNTSDCYDLVKENDYFFAFLSPSPKAFLDSSYRDFLMTETPSSTQVNALSPIVYLDIDGVRFIFTGDAPFSQEKVALSLNRINKVYYQKQGISVNLENIDFLKVGHHGANDSSSWDFLETLTPKNFVISVAGNNFYGHPTTEVLERILTVNPNGKIYRTDVHGTISVLIDDDGQINVQTDIG